MKIHKNIHRYIQALLLLCMATGSYAQNPTWEWARSFATSHYEIAKQVAVDEASRHVYVVGDWDDDLSLTFPGGANPSTQFNSTYGQMDGFVAKYDQDGTLIWAFKVGGENDDQINSVALDQGGNVYITGMVGEGSTIYFSGSSPHTGSSTLSNTSDLDFFLAKYNPDGEFLWVRRSASNFGNLIGQDLCLTSDAVYAVGTATGWATFGSLSMALVPNQEDIFLIKYALDGTELWMAEAGSNDIDLVTEVVADESHVYYIGHFEGSNLGLRDGSGGNAASEGNVNNGRSDIIVASYDQNGLYTWSQTIASTENDIGQGMTLDADSLYITGSIDDNATFPNYAGNPLFTSSNMDIFISSHAKSNGNTGWVHVLPCTDGGDENGRCVDTDAFGNLLLTGDYKNDLMFPGGINLTAIQDEDVFVAAFTTNGAFRWAESAGSNSRDEGYGLAAGPGGSIYLAGQYDHEMLLGPLTLPDEGNSNGFLAKLQDDLPPPVNDTPCAALLLTVGDTCASEIHNNLGATDSGIPDPGCGSYAGFDVWYKAVVPASGNFFLGTNTTNNDIFPPLDGYMWNVNLAVYSGDCNSLSQLTCAAGNSAYNSRASSAFLFDQVPGDTVWIRVWEANAAYNGFFSICAYDPGHFPGWDLPGQICEENGPIDLDTTLSDLLMGNADAVLSATGIPNPDFALGSSDGSSALLEDNGDIIILDLSDTIPAGERIVINMRSNPVVSGETRFVLRTSLDNLSYVDHSFRPEVSSDTYLSHIIIAEEATRYIWLENSIAGGGGFQVDGIAYFFRATRGGSWSGPGVTGSIFDPAGLLGPVSITYSVGGSSTRTDSIRSVEVLQSLGGTLGNDTTVCSGDPGLQLNLSGYRGVVIGWESSTDGFLTPTSIPVFDAYLDVSGLAVTTSFRAIVQDGSCEPDTSDILTVTILEIPLADPGPYGDVCGSNLGLQAVPSLGTGSWVASGPGTATFAPSAANPIVSVDVDQYGSYTFTWTEVNGTCSDDSTFTVEFYEPPLADPGPYGDVCGSNLGLQAVPSVGTGSWTASGPGTATFAPSAANPIVSVDVDQYGSYTFTWTEVNGTCSDDSTFTVEFFEPPAADPGPYGDVCGSNLGLQAVPSVGIGSWTASGPGTATFTPSAANPIVSVDVDQYGTYTFTWTELNGTCSDDSTFTVEFFEPPVAFAGVGGDACGLTYALNAVPSVGTGVWTLETGPGAAIFSPTANSANASVTVSGSGVYNFLWTETNGTCSQSALVSVNFIESPVAEAGTGGDWCGPDYQLSAIPSIGSGLWTQTGGPGTANFTPSADVSDARVTVNVNGIYEFTWTETNASCVDRDSVEVTFLDNLDVDVGADADVCGTTYDLSALPPDVPGNWIASYGPGIASFAPIAVSVDATSRVTVDAYGEYMFRWEAALGICTGADSLIVNFHAPPVADAGPDQVLEFEFSTYLEASLLSADVAAVNAAGIWTLVSGSGLLANPGDPGTQVTDLQLGENVFQWTLSSSHCPDVSDQVTITVNDVQTYTVITPNNDGLNDFLVFPGVQDLRGCEIVIFNRWGIEVYRNENYQNNWDGRDHRDRDLISDTYYYILKIPPDRIIKSFVEIRRSQ